MIGNDSTNNDIYHIVREMWRTFVSRRWAFSIKINRTDVRPMYDETLSGKSTLCILESDIFVTLDLPKHNSITPRQRELIVQAHKQCADRRYSSNYDVILRNFLLTQ